MSEPVVRRYQIRYAPDDERPWRVVDTTDDSVVSTQVYLTAAVAICSRKNGEDAAPGGIRAKERELRSG